MTRTLAKPYLSCMILFLQANLHQVSAFEALRVGHYDGSYEVTKLTRYGDFGLGTYNGLDGEMVVLGGRIFQINGFGDVHSPQKEAKTPFAFVTHFEANKSFTIAHPISSAGLQAEIDRRFPTGIVAIHIHGTISNLMARSFAPQHKPYLPFASITDRQSLFPYGSAAGDLVGFRMPKDVGTLNVPGYHFHFISADRTHGGHVLKFGIRSGEVDLMPIKKIDRIGP